MIKVKHWSPLFLMANLTCLLSFPVFSSCVTQWTDYVIMTKIGQNNEQIWLANIHHDDYMNEIIALGGFSRDHYFADWANKKYFNNNKVVAVPQDFNEACISFNYQSPTGVPMYARNFDIGANVPAIVVLNQSKIGYRYIANTTYTFFTDPIPTTAGEIANVAKISGYVPLDGMNEKGLCVSMNNYQFSSSAPKYLNQNYPNRVDMTITILFKYLLQNASTVNEAIGLINQVNVHDNLQLSGNNNHIQIADRNHNSVIVEFNDDEQQSIRLIHPRANEKFLINENFTYDFPEAQWSTVKNNNPRYATAYNALSTNNGVLDNGMNLLAQCKQNNYTTWSVIYNMKELSVDYIWNSQFNQAPHRFYLQ